MNMQETEKGTPIIRTKNVSRVFRSGGNKIQALKDIDINVYPGTLTLFKGRSGSGKTTLINLIGALDEPTTGTIYFEDGVLTSMSSGKKDALRRNKIGFIFQSVALISMMTALENIDFSLRVSKYPARERLKRAEECLRMVGLRNRMTHVPGEMSGGEQQRVAIARSIAHHPIVLFADEPTAELDTHMALQVMKILRQLVISENVTIVMTTHDPNMMVLADHIYELEDGRIINETFNKVENDEVVADFHPHGDLDKKQSKKKLKRVRSKFSFRKKIKSKGKGGPA